MRDRETALEARELRWRGGVARCRLAQLAGVGHVLGVVHGDQRSLGQRQSDVEGAGLGSRQAGWDGDRAHPGRLRRGGQRRTGRGVVGFDEDQDLELGCRIVEGAEPADQEGHYARFSVERHQHGVARQVGVGHAPWHRVVPAVRQAGGADQPAKAYRGKEDRTHEHGEDRGRQQEHGRRCEQDAQRDTYRARVHRAARAEARLKRRQRQARAPSQRRTRAAEHQSLEVRRRRERDAARQRVGRARTGEQHSKRGTGRCHQPASVGEPDPAVAQGTDRIRAGGQRRRIGAEGNVDEMGKAAIIQRVGDAASGEEGLARVRSLAEGLSYGGLQQFAANTVFPQERDLGRKMVAWRAAARRGAERLEEQRPGLERDTHERRTRLTLRHDRNARRWRHHGAEVANR